VPVVTLFTDVLDSGRVAYVGLDNAAAGSTPAYLLGHWLATRPSDVLVTLSRSLFFGERERVDAFAQALAKLSPGRAIHMITETDGLDATMAALVGEHPEIGAVYSVGGGNRATVDAFEAAGRECHAFIAHDLDADNVELLRSGTLAAVLHHDLRADMRRAMRQLMRHHRLLPGAPTSVLANVEVITPYNVPPRLLPT
jgi:LacI family transcriptional regulator